MFQRKRPGILSPRHHATANTHGFGKQIVSPENIPNQRQRMVTEHDRRQPGAMGAFQVDTAASLDEKVGAATKPRHRLRG